MHRKAIILAAAIMSLVSGAHAAFTLLENFNGLSIGTINGQQGWVGSGTADGRVVTDPADAGNRVLSVTNVTGNVYHALDGLTLPNASTGTLYFRLRWPGPALHAYIGLLDVSTPAGGGSTSDYETQVGFDQADSSLLKVRDSSTYKTVGTLESNVWYRIWMVHNNPRDLYSVYIQGGAWPTPVLLLDTSAQTWFTFRNTSGDGLNTNSAPQANALSTFAVKSGTAHAGPLYVDDIYIDPASANLAIPEPRPPDTNAPTTLSISPNPGATVGSLTALSVTFNEPVVKVDRTNLLINGAFPTGVTGADATWTWEFPQPPTGAVSVAWAGGQTISDLASNRFLPALSSWSYTLLPPDTAAPYVVSALPEAGGTVSVLSQVTVVFNEPVQGVQPDDLLVNDMPSLGVIHTGHTATFAIVSPAQGPVTVRFDGAHGITDLAGNRLDETATNNRWSYTRLDTTPPASGPSDPLAECHRDSSHSR